MTKKTTTNERHSCFLRVSDYYKKYFEMKYGKPVRFPRNSLLGVYMQTHLFRDPDFSGITDFSYNEIAFNMLSEKTLFSAPVKLLTDSEKQDFLELEMPETVYKFNGEVKVDKFFHLNINGSKKVRNELKREFWYDFSRFHDECIFRASRLGEHVTSEDIMSDFISLYDIDMRKFESMMRYWWRIKARMKSEISLRKEEIEAKTSRVCIYTP